MGRLEIGAADWTMWAVAQDTLRHDWCVALRQRKSTHFELSLSLPHLPRTNSLSLSLPHLFRTHFLVQNSYFWQLSRSWVGYSACVLWHILVLLLATGEPQTRHPFGSDPSETTHVRQWYCNFHPTASANRRVLESVLLMSYKLQLISQTPRCTRRLLPMTKCTRWVVDREQLSNERQLTSNDAEKGPHLYSMIPAEVETHQYST